MEASTITTAVCSAGFALTAKLIYDHITANRHFVTRTECKRSQETCPSLARLNTEQSTHKARTDQRFKELHRYTTETHETVNRVSSDISQLRTDIAVLSSHLTGRATK